MGADKKNLVCSYVILFVSCFMLYVYEPILMYATNINDFWFDFRLMIVPVVEIFVIIFGFGTIVVTVIYIANKFLDNNILLFKGIVLIGFVLFLCAYIQGNWMVSNLPPLDGTSIKWDDIGQTENKIIVVILIVLLCISAVALKNKSDRAIKMAAAISLVIFAMLFVSLASIVLGKHAWKNKDLMGFTTENFSDASEAKNVLIFLVDAVGSSEFMEVLSANPQYADTFEDFTYYTDAASTFGFTRDSIPVILSGIVNKNDEEYLDYCTRAYDNSPLFALLNEMNYDINIYDDEMTWSSSIKWNIRNAVPSGIRFRAFFEQETKYILYKYLPYGLKKLSGIESIGFYRCRDNTDLDCSNQSIYSNVCMNSALEIQSTNLFQFVHIEGAHTPFDIDKNLKFIENGTYEQKIEASVTVIDAYIKRLKDNCVYDNSAIVILADHGNAMYNTDEDILKRFNPILLIKGFDEHHEFITSDAPVSFTDLQEAYRDLLDGRNSSELFRQIEQGRTRKFIWYRYTKEEYMVEYETDGTMQETERFVKTGNIYNLLQREQGGLVYKNFNDLIN